MIVEVVFMVKLLSYSCYFVFFFRLQLGENVLFAGTTGVSCVLDG